MPAQKNKLISLFTELLPEESVINNPVEGLTLFRVNESFDRTPYAYNSEIIILGQGEKAVYLGDEVFKYDPANYLVLPVPLPAVCAGTTEPDRPILGMSIAIDPVEISEMLFKIKNSDTHTTAIPRGIYSAPVNQSISDACHRLLKALKSTDDRQILAPMIKREIIYRVLQGEKGAILQALVYSNRRFFQIAKILQRIHKSYNHDFDIEALAAELHMSNSTFHSSFKAVTGTSPLQYIKNIRLHKARELIIQDGLNAHDSALHVGYESPSQFNREYKRLFGVTPGKELLLQTGS